MAQHISKSLRDMLTILRSEKFTAAPPSQQLALVVTMHKDAAKLKTRIAGMPAEVQQLLAPTCDKVLQFMAAFAEQAGEAQAAAAAEYGPDGADDNDDEDEEEEVEEDDDSAVSPLFLAARKQMEELVEMVQSDKFQALDRVPKIKVVMELQQVLARTVERVQKLEGEELEVAMENAQAVNGLLQATATPLLTDDEAEAAEEAQEAPPAGEEEVALDIVQKTNQLFSVVNSDEFTNAPLPQRAELLELVSLQLTELIGRTGTLSVEHQESLLPLLQGLETMVQKLGASNVAASEAADDGRGEIFETAEKATVALRNGMQGVNAATVIQLMKLLDELDRCGVSNENELRIRQEFQAVLSDAVEALEAGVDSAVANHAEAELAAIALEQENGGVEELDDEREEEEGTPTSMVHMD
jgi:hypothetical protein